MDGSNASAGGMKDSPQISYGRCSLSSGIYKKPAGPNGEMGYLRADFEPVWKAMGIRP
jgi:hypothetical protein